MKTPAEKAASEIMMALAISPAAEDVKAQIIEIVTRHLARCLSRPKAGRLFMMTEFGLVKSFGIDEGELGDASPQQCFVLGYELAQIDQLLKDGEAIHRPVHAANRERIEASCKDAACAFTLSWMPTDSSEEWMLLEVFDPA